MRVWYMAAAFNFYSPQSARFFAFSPGFGKTLSPKFEA
jgi:hypothetical protein